MKITLKLTRETSEKAARVAKETGLQIADLLRIGLGRVINEHDQTGMVRIRHRIPSRIVKRLDAAAKSCGQSRSAFLREQLPAYMERLRVAGCEHTAEQADTAIPAAVRECAAWRLKFADDLLSLAMELAQPVGDREALLDRLHLFGMEMSLHRKATAAIG